MHHIILISFFFDVFFFIYISLCFYLLVLIIFSLVFNAYGQSAISWLVRRASSEDQNQLFFFLSQCSMVDDNKYPMTVSWRTWNSNAAFQLWLKKHKIKAALDATSLFWKLLINIKRTWCIRYTTYLTDNTVIGTSGMTRYRWKTFYVKSF